MSIASNFPSSLPSLLLDFANVKRLDPRITFTRTTTATYYDGVTTAKAEENLFTYSQNSTTNWTNFSSRLTITTSYEAAPDGTTTGMRLVNSSGSTGYFYQNVGSNILVSGTTYTLSVYVKSNTGSSQTISLMIPDTGTTTNVTATTTWSRVSWTPTLASTNSFAGLVLSNGADISVWGFQLEQRSSATAYTATTSQAITNYIPVLQTASAGQARFDHNPTTGESLGLLIEEARTNSLTYSADLGNAYWNNNNINVTTNTIIAPDGTLTGDKVAANTTSGGHYSYPNAGIVVSAGTYTASIYAKAGERSRLLAALYSGSNYEMVQFDLSNGTILQEAVAGIASITSVGNGWYRCTVTRTLGAVTTYFSFGPYTNTTLSNLTVFPTYAGDGFNGIFIWGAQLEAGSFATSYIPTTGSTATRNADAASMTGTNFSSWFNGGAGTVFTESLPISATASSRVCAFSDGSSSNRILIIASTGNHLYVDAYGSNVADLDGGTYSSSVFNKQGSGYAVNDYAVTINGGAIASDSSGATPVGINVLYIGADSNGTSNILNGRIRKLAYYPIRVTNAQLQSLTV